MLSTDRDILLSINGQIVRLNAELQAIHAEQRVLHEEQRVLTAKIDGIQHSLYWGLSIIGIIIAVFALWLSTPKAKQRQSEIPNPPQTTLQQQAYEHHNSKQSA